MKNIILVTGGRFCRIKPNKVFIKTNKKIISLDNYSSGFKENHIRSHKIKYISGSTDKLIKKYQIYKKIHSVFHFGEFSRIIKVLKNLMNVIGLTQSEQTLSSSIV